MTKCETTVSINGMNPMPLDAFETAMKTIPCAVAGQTEHYNAIVRLNASVIRAEADYVFAKGVASEKKKTYESLQARLSKLISDGSELPNLFNSDTGEEDEEGDSQ